MALDFPTSPALNEIYTYGGRSWKWNGTAWDVYSTVSGDVVTKLNGLTGGVTLAAGSNITLTPVGNTITIASSGGGGTGSGATGATGPQGNTGSTGPTGATGPQGNTGATGSTPTNYVASFNGLTGAVTGVASIGGFTGTITFSDGRYTTVQKSSNDISIDNVGVRTLSISSGSGINALTASGTTGTISYSISNTGVTGIQAGTGISVSSTTGNPTITNIGVQLFNGLTGSVTGVTLGGAAFTGLVSSTTGFSGPGTNLTGNASGLTAGTATAVNISTSNTATTQYLVFASGVGGKTLGIDSTTSPLTYVPSTGSLSVGSSTSSSLSATSVNTTTIYGPNTDFLTLTNNGGGVAIEDSNGGLISVSNILGNINLDSPNSIFIGDINGSAGGGSVTISDGTGTVTVSGLAFNAEYANFTQTLTGVTANFTGRVSSTVGFSGPGTNITGLVSSFNGLTGAVLADAVPWSVITADQTAVINKGYFTNKSTLLTLTLPSTAAVGSVLRVSGMTASGWKVAQNASGVIHFGKTDTTVGVTGYIQSTLARDAVELICCVANNEWNVLSSVGNITIV